MNKRQRKKICAMQVQETVKSMQDAIFYGSSVSRITKHTRNISIIKHIPINEMYIKQTAQ